MHPILDSIASELHQLAVALNASVTSDEPFNTVHNNWSFPGLTRNELVDAARMLEERIRDRGKDDLGASEKRLGDYVRRLVTLRTQTVPNLWSNAGLAVSAYLNTLYGLRTALEPVLTDDASAVSDLSATARRLGQRLRALELRVSADEPRAANLAEMLVRVEQATEVADQLPADLQTLSEDRARMLDLRQAAEKDIAEIAKRLADSNELAAKLIEKEKEATSVLSRCDLAYTAATSQGLAAAFTERSKALGFSMWVWVTAFVADLIAGGYFGVQRMNELNELVKNPAITNAALILNLLLATLSVGAPIWFGWLATKQINQRFRLAEDMRSRRRYLVLTKVIAKRPLGSTRIWRVSCLPRL